MNTCDTCQHWEPSFAIGGRTVTKIHGTCDCPKFIETVGVDDDSADTLNYWDYESYSAGFSVGPKFGCIHYSPKP